MHTAYSSISQLDVGWIASLHACALSPGLARHSSACSCKLLPPRLFNLLAIVSKG